MSTLDEFVAPPDRISQRERLDRATAHIDPPFAVIDLNAWDANADDLARRAAGIPIRVVSKSIRSRSLIQDVLGKPGFRGVLAYALPEALWLVGEGITDDVLVAYPSTDRAGLRRLVADEAAAAAVTLTIDDLEQLDLVDSVAAPTDRPIIRVCLDLDTSWQPAGERIHIGVRRSPLRTPEQFAQLAAEIVKRPGFSLVGLMAYEAQVAGVGDAPTGRWAYSVAVRAMQALSMRELMQRRAAAVDAVREVANIEFVTGGGTGSIEKTLADGLVTEVAAGSGLFGPHLFDHYRAFHPLPAALFAVPVVRRPGPGVVTVLGGGYVASGAPGRDRLPLPWLPEGLELDPREAAGEVQTPLLGPAADSLRIGDRVWFRHAKAGEMCERFSRLHLVRFDEQVDVVPTYRGEGRTFL